MSANDTNQHEDAEMDECDNEKVVTMMDVLQEQTDIEEDANAVLGASDDKNCTYSKGHLKRQAIYACMTCCPDAKTDPTKRGGVCLACSLTCHESHDLIELYTKRNFRCDCGNPMFNSHLCQFTPVKTDLNEENSYNQNFSGLYCICHRPYPDPESKVEVEMIQCIICEDWLHATHLDAVVPNNDQYSEMICKACMERNEFLHDYSNLAVNVENVEVDVLNKSTEISDTSVCNDALDADESTSVNEDIESNENNDAKGDAVEKKVDEQNTNTSEEMGANIEPENSVCNGALNADESKSVNEDIESNENNDAKGDAVEKKVDEQNTNTSEEMGANIEPENSVCNGALNTDESTSVNENIESIENNDGKGDEVEKTVDDQNTKTSENMPANVDPEDSVCSGALNADESTSVNENIESKENNDAKGDEVEKTVDEQNTKMSENMPANVDPEDSVCSGALNADESTSVNENIESNENNDAKGDEVEKTVDEQNTKTSENMLANVDPEDSVCSGALNVDESTSVNENIESNENNDAQSDAIEKTVDEQNTNTSEDMAAKVDSENSVKTESTDKSDSVDKEDNNDKPEVSEQVLDESTNVTTGDHSDSKNEQQHSETNVPNESEMEANDCPENKTDKKDNPVNEESDEEELMESSDNVVITENDNKSEENEIPKETEITEEIFNKEQMEEDLLLADPIQEQETNEDNETIQKVSTNNELTTDNNPTYPSKDMDTSESESISNPVSTENSNGEKSFTDTASVLASIDSKGDADSKKENDALDLENMEQTIELSAETDKVTEETESMEITESVTEPKPEDENNEVATEKGNNSNEDESNATKGVSESSDETNKEPDAQKRKHSTETNNEESSMKKRKLEESKSCVRPRDVRKIYQGATFWPSNFRRKLCTCNDCITMYKDLSVLFLIDPADTVSAYETIGKEKCEGNSASQYEKGLQALSSLDRVQQINALTEYNKMKDKLIEFLKSFKDRKEIVREEDIKVFFAGMKPKREPDGIYFCR